MQRKTDLNRYFKMKQISYYIRFFPLDLVIKKIFFLWKVFEDEEGKPADTAPPVDCDLHQFTQQVETTVSRLLFLLIKLNLCHKFDYSSITRNTQNKNA